MYHIIIIIIIGIVVIFVIFVVLKLDAAFLSAQFQAQIILSKHKLFRRLAAVPSSLSAQIFPTEGSNMPKKIVFNLYVWKIQLVLLPNNK